jgi:hypothetical protein
MNIRTIFVIFMKNINLKELSLNCSIKPKEHNSAQTGTLPNFYEAEKFFTGPIPLRWLMKATKQPGKAFHVAICIWHLARLKGKITIKLSQKMLRGFNVKRNAAYRGLRALEFAGLVNVERNRGRNSIVTIIGLPKKNLN